MAIPRLVINTRLKRLVHKDLPTTSSWLWKVVPVRIYDSILTWLYPN